MPGRRRLSLPGCQSRPRLWRAGMPSSCFARPGSAAASTHMTFVYLVFTAQKSFWPSIFIVFDWCASILTDVRFYESKQRSTRNRCSIARSARMPSGFLDAVENQQLGALRELENRVLAVEPEPLDGPVDRAEHEDTQRHDLDVGPDFAGAARVEKELIPVPGIGAPKRPLCFLEMLRQLSVDPYVGRRELAGLE